MAKTKTHDSDAAQADADAGGADELQQARQRVADLEAEQAALPDRIAAARQKREAEEWMSLLDRQDELPGELEQARRDLLAPELKAAWQIAEQRYAEVEAADAAYQQARADRDAGRRQPREDDDAQTAATIWQRNAELQTAYDEAREQWQRAHHALWLALADVDDLEERYRELIGDEPPAGDGLCAPVGQLAIAVQRIHPRDYIVGASYQPAPAQKFTPGKVPPRWAAVQITNPKAWNGREQPDHGFVPAGVRITTDAEGRRHVEGGLLR
jgi:predicted nucleic acid-binding protein